MADGPARAAVWAATGQNSGNNVWNEGALDLLDGERTIVRSTRELLGNKTTPPQPPVAFVLPTANLLMPHSRRHETSLPASITGMTRAFTATVERLAVPTLLVGIGVQVGFTETEAGGADSGYNGNTASVKEYYEQRRRGAAVRGLNRSALLLNAEQRHFLDVVTAHTRHGARNVAVRGDVSAEVCLNSGVTGCMSLGCPSLMLSRDDALGASLQAKWTALAARPRQGAPPLRLAFGLPALWSDELAHLFVSAGREHPDFIVVLQMEVDVDSVRRLQKMGLHVHHSQVRLFDSVAEWVATLATCDVYIGARIHGGLAATAASTPAVVVATDVRMDELAKRVGLPTVRATSLSAQPIFGAFLNQRAASFNGTAFDRNRREIARGYVEIFTALGVPASQHVRQIAGGEAL